MAETFNKANVLLQDAPHGVISPERTQVIADQVMNGSAIMKLGKYVEMTDANGNPVKEKRFTYLAEGPGAYWVEEGKRIETSKATWLEAKMVAHKLAVIIPVSREFLHYRVEDFLTEIQPLIAEAFYKKFDEAGILNVNNPFRQSIEQSVTTASTVVEGDITYDNILAVEDKVLDGNHQPNAFISKLQNTNALRGATKTENGVAQALYDRTAGTLDTLPVANVDSKELKKGVLYTGNFNHLFYGIPFNITYEVSKEATLTTIVDSESNPINLFERDLIALRATMDIGMMITKDNAFAKLKPQGV